MTTERIGKYLLAGKHPRLDDRVTDRWQIMGNDRTILGRVAWYGPWRQYTFDPCERTTFNETCLLDIAAFLRRVNAERRAAAAGRGPVAA